MRYDFPNILPAVIDRIWQKITMFWYRSRSPMLAWFWGVKHKGGVRFQGKTIIRTHRVGEILLGRNVVFNAQKVANLVGLMGSNILHVFNGGRIVVGDNTGFSSVVLSSRSAIKIGSRVKVGGNVRIFDHDFHSTDSVIRASSKDRDYVRSKPIVIEDDVFIGTNALILKGTEIGARSIVAAGSVVFGLKVPPDSLVKGNPAQIVSVKK